jgi:hypothetical protein
MKLISVGLFLIPVFSASAQLPNDLPKSLASLSIECRETQTHLAHDDERFRDSMLEDQGIQKTLGIEVRNDSNSESKAIVVIYFLVRDARGGQDVEIDSSDSRECELAGRGSDNWSVITPLLIQHVNRMDYTGGIRSGEKPAGWIIGFLENGRFYPQQASNPATLDFSNGGDFGQKWSDYENQMPASLDERQKKERRQNGED